MKTLKSRLAVMLDSVLQWLRLARRARPEEPVSPQQLQTALTEMLAVPYADVNIRGQMKPFQSELYFKSPASGGHNYNVEAPAINYVASLTRVEPSLTINQWAGYFVDSPCSECGSQNKVTNGYGIWVYDLEDAVQTLVKANAAAIKIDGLNEYSRILWGSVTGSWSSVYSPGAGVLEFSATNGVRTKSGVGFTVGGNTGDAICNALGYRVAGAAAPSGNYLRGNGTNFVSSAIQPADMPDASVSAGGKVNTSSQTFAGLKTFQDGVDGSGPNAGVRHRYFVQEARPTLNPGETAFWFRPSDGECGLLHFSGGNYFWWHGTPDGGVVHCAGNPS